MARLGSVGCGPLPVLLLLLLLASVPAMAASWESVALEALVEFFHLLFQKMTPKAVGEFAVGSAEKLIPGALREMNAPEGFIKGVKGGFKTCKTLKKISGLIQQQNPDNTTTYYAVVIIHTGNTSSPSPTPTVQTQLPVLTVDITAMTHVGLCGLDVTVGPSRAVVGFGNGGELSKTFPKFSYQVQPDGTAAVWLPTTPPPPNGRTVVWVPRTPPPPQGRHLGESSQLVTTTIPLYTNPKYLPRDGRYYVKIIGIAVDDEVVWTPTKLGFRPDGTGGVYLSTTEPYTYLESSVYGRLKATLMSRIERLNPGAVPTSLDATRELCYVRAELMVPPMTILFAGGNAAMDLEAANVWYGEGPYTICLAILPTNLTSPGQASILGSLLQSGKMMTIDVTPGTSGTLTF